MAQLSRSRSSNWKQAGRCAAWRVLTIMFHPGKPRACAVNDLRDSSCSAKIAGGLFILASWR